MKWGRSSFKLGNWVAHNQTGRANAWIEHNQRLFNSEDVVLRVFKENGGWDRVDAGKGMFGAPPQDPGIWDHHFLKNYWNEDERKPKRVKSEHITPLNRRVTEWFFKTSQETGCTFELVIIATLKHVDRVGNGHIDHIIRQELLMFDGLREKFPRAKVIVSACNEWDAHNFRRDPWDEPEKLTLRTANMWAERRGRDRYGWFDLIVDHGGQDEFDYKVGMGRDTYDWGMLHPVRTRSRWWEAPPTGPIVKACNGRPYGATESMYYVEMEDAQRAATWYRNPAGWQTDVKKQMQLYQNLKKAGFTYIIVHDEKGAQCDVDWPRRETRLEAELRNYFGGTIMRRKFEPIISLAYDNVLGRPVDALGLENYNRLMHEGMTEAQMRESLIRSAEYAENNPEGE